MIKKIFAVSFLFMLALAINQSFVCADEILDSKGNIAPCKIETVMDGLIQYKKDGSLYSFQRSKDQPIFNDYVDVRVNLFKKESDIRYTGKIIAKDSDITRIRNENVDMEIPWYRVKFIGVYKPD